MTASAHKSEADQPLPPGLDLATPYYSRLSARSALYTDLCLLLDRAGSSLRSLDFRDMIVEQNCLARSSESARRKMWKELKARYVLDATSPLFAAFWSEWTRCESEPERGLTAYCLLALQDKLVADLGLEFLFPRLRRAPAELRVDDVLGFIKASALAHPEVGGWSDKTTTAVAQKYGASIRDFGLARGTIRFIDARRHDDFATSRALVNLVRNHPIPDEHTAKPKLEQGMKDMDALIADETVIARWPDYRSAYEQARDAYRDAFLEVYEGVRTQAGAALTAIKAGDAYAEAPSSERDAVVDAVFGAGRACDYPAITLPTTHTLLAACAKRSLTSLAQAAFALPAYRSQVEAALRDLVVPPPPPDKTWEWRPNDAFAGKRLSTTDEVDELLTGVGDELKAQIRAGLVVVVK